MYDIAIVGLGPAGATLARLLDSGLKVVALDRKRLDGLPCGFEKPCGGLLSPSAQKVLAEMGLNVPSSLLANPQIFAVKTMDLVSGHCRHYQRSFLNIHRHKFDLWLTSLIPPSVEIIDRADCRRVIDHCSHYEIVYSRHGIVKSLMARRVVGADGSASLVRRTFVPTPIRRYLCLQEFYADPRPWEPFGCFFDPRYSDCYGWINHKDSQRVLGAALPLHGPRARFEALKEALKRFGYHFDGPPQRVEAALVSRPAGLGQLALGRGENLFLIGEAAGFVSPSSLEGISYALATGRALAEVLPSTTAMRKYSRALWPLRLKIAGRLAKNPFMYQPFLRRMVMGSGLKSLKINR